VSSWFCNTSISLPDFVRDNNKVINPIKPETKKAKDEDEHGACKKQG
jgi:hypothetical protein